MAGIVGTTIYEVLYGAVMPYLSDDLDENTEAVFDPAAWDEVFQVNVSAYYSVDRMPAANTWGGLVSGFLPQFRQDFYERIHITPTRIDLGTIANTITREISVWNAYTEQSATLTSILIQNGEGISITGPATPFVFTPLLEAVWEVGIASDGPPQVNAQIIFEFSDVTDPSPVIIIGSRAVVQPTVPEVPVRELWAWLTDTRVSVDGTEQRIGLRKVPRRDQETELAFFSEQELREQYGILLSAFGRLFVPYWQYSSPLMAAATPGATVLSVDSGPLDIRDDDYILIMAPDESVTLLQVETVGMSNLTLKGPISNTFQKGWLVVAVYPSLLPNNLSLDRIAANTHGSVRIRSQRISPQSSFTRPGSTEVLPLLDGMAVLIRRPVLPDGSVAQSFDTGQETKDSRVGLVQLVTDWDFTKVEQEFTFKARRSGRTDCGHRTGTQEFDYWRAFFDNAMGSLRPFLLSSYRPDQVIFTNPGAGSDSLILTGGSYADNFFSIEPYQYLEIETEVGSHYVKVTAASKGLDGNTSITFAPALPNKPGWDVVKRISYLKKLRIANDRVTLDHYARDTFFSFRARTVKA